MRRSCHVALLRARVLLLSCLFFAVFGPRIALAQPEHQVPPAPTASASVHRALTNEGGGHASRDDGGQNDAGLGTTSVEPMAPAESASAPAPPASSVPPTPSTSASAHEAKPSASAATEVRVRDKVVFVVRTG